MKRILISVVLAAICLSSFGQKQEEKKKFQIKGQPIVTVFANYHAGIGNANKESGFALDRAYLGYQFSLTEKLSGKVVFDMGSTKVSGSDLERVAYIKNAMLSWKTGNFTLDFGLIGLEQFNVHEIFARFPVEDLDLLIFAGSHKEMVAFSINIACQRAVS